MLLGVNLALGIINGIQAIGYIVAGDITYLTVFLGFTSGLCLSVFFMGYKGRENG